MPKHCSLNCAHTFLKKHLNVLILKQVVGPSKQTNIHMHVQNAVPTVWGSFGLAPTREVQSLWGEPEPVAAQNFVVTSSTGLLERGKLPNNHGSYHALGHNGSTI